MRFLVTAVSVAAVAGLSACGGEGRQGDGSSPAAASPTPPRAAQLDGPTLVAAGDIACPPGMRRTRTSCRHADTADLVESLDPDVVAPLGDLQYDKGQLSSFRRVYGPTWGRFKSKSRPAPGNHEYATPGAAGYYAYWGARAGPRGRGWYSYDAGSWHVVVLNSNCSKVGCRPGSAQERWLRADLARHRSDCTLAYWHHPRFSSGLHGNDTSVAPLWRALERARAEIVLSGHDHSYERFGPQTSTGRASRNGVVQFVVGTGGVNNYPLVRTKPNSRIRRSFLFGVLELTLGEGRYAWRYHSVPGLTFTDTGTARCR